MSRTNSDKYIDINAQWDHSIKLKSGTGRLGVHGRQKMFPDSIIIDFLGLDMNPVRLFQLGSTFIQLNGLESVDNSLPLKVAASKQTSKAGNFYYSYEQNQIPFPDGLATQVRVEGIVVPFGKVRLSQKGHPTREGTAQIIIGGVLYKVTAYLSESKNPYFVKVVAHKKPQSGVNILKAQAVPRGGRIVC